MIYKAITEDDKFSQEAPKASARRARSNTSWDVVTEPTELWELSGKDINGNEVVELCLSKATSKTQWAEFPEMNLVRS